MLDKLDIRIVKGEPENGADSCGEISIEDLANGGDLVEGASDVSGEAISLCVKDVHLGLSISEEAGHGVVDGWCSGGGGGEGRGGEDSDDCDSDFHFLLF